MIKKCDKKSEEPATALARGAVLFGQGCKARKTTNHAHTMDACHDALNAFIAERDRRKAIEGMRRGEIKDPKTIKGASWNPEQKRYETKINLSGVLYHLKSYSDVEKNVAVQLYWNFMNAKPGSLTNKRKHREEIESANAEKRAKNIESRGGNCALERELLTNTAEAMTSGGVISFIVLMLQSKADALFRTADMPKDKYKREQHKTCTKIYENSRGHRRYKFNSVTGYTDCLVVFECKEDGATFAARGDDIDKAFADVKTPMLEILLNKTGEPVLGNKEWLSYLGKGDEARINLEKRLKKECMDDTLPSCTISEANSELGKHHATEEEGIKYLIQTEFGGIVSDDDPAWNALPSHMHGKRHIYMLTKKNGDVVAYPEYVAQGKTDLLVYQKAHNYENPEKWQCKTASFMNCNGFNVNMRNSYGKVDGKARQTNKYNKNDNDMYVILRPPKDGGVFHYWKFTEAEMIQHGYICGDLGTFVVYTKDAPPERKMAHAWTVRNHYSALV